ncbi:MAG: protein kinase, partial [Planctomycetia bacterium]|nr:protein kinase [Planctomycetia bacterium]
MAEQSLSGIAGDWALPDGAKLDNGNITIRGVLGEGGFGVTYRADDLFFGEIALKEFLPKSMVMKRSDQQGSYDVIVKPEKAAAYKHSMRQFWREPRIISSLKHPNIVEVLFDFQENNTAYYGMRLLKGMELAKWLQKRGKPLDYNAASEIMLPVADALVY